VKNAKARKAFIYFMVTIGVATILVRLLIDIGFNSDALEHEKGDILTQPLKINKVSKSALTRTSSYQRAAKPQKYPSENDLSVPAFAEPEIDIFMALELIDKIKFNEDGSVRVDGDAYYLLRDAWWMLRNNTGSADFAKVELLLDAHLSEEQSAATKEILFKYLEYKNAEEMLTASGDGTLATVSQLEQRKKALRKSYFGEEIAKTLFAEEEQFLKNTMKEMQRQHSKSNDQAVN